MNPLLKAITHPVKTVKLINRRYFGSLDKKNKDREVSFLNSWIYGKLPRVELISVFSGIENISFGIVNGFQRTNNMSITLQEICNIVAIEKFINASLIMEIGTYDGGTTVNLAANTQENGAVYTIDLPPDFKKYDLSINSFNDNKSNFVLSGSQYKRTEFAYRINQIYCDSAKYNFADLNVMFDLFFIDGNHDYNYVKKDTESALRYTKKGGVIVWHDYGMIEDVSKYIDEISEMRKIHVIQGTRLAVSIVE